MRSTRGGGTCLNAPVSHPEGVNPTGSSLCNKSKAGLPRLKPRNDFFAFTLAEVLVTLGIIGVVSAMTVPSLIQNYQRQSYVTQLHKVYNETSQALLQYQTERNALNLKEAGLASQDAINEFIKSHFRVVQECDNMDNCFADEYKSMKGAVMTSYARERKSFVLASGASIRPTYTLEGNKLINIAVDTNGQKGPNIAGRDLFWLYVYNNGLIDDYPVNNTINAPLTKEQREDNFNNLCLGTSPDSGCFGKILNDNWQMTY